jgi:TolA-binding protein
MAAADRDAPPGAEPDLAHLGEDVDALRRRLDDHGALVRRTQQSISQLADSVGKIVEGQRRRDRRQTLNSFVAYILFTVLLGGGFLILYRSRASGLEHARKDAVADLEAARKELRAAQGQLQARTTAAARAYAFYQLIRDGKRAEAIASYADVAHLALSPTEREVLADGEKQARARLVDAGFVAGLDAYKAKSYAKAVTELGRAVAYESGGPNSAQLHYYLGVSLVKIGKPGDAIDPLEAALDARIDQAGIDDARFWLAMALEGAGKRARARREYDRVASEQPMSALASAARRRSAQLALHGPTN